VVVGELVDGSTSYEPVEADERCSRVVQFVADELRTRPRVLGVLVLQTGVTSQSPQPREVVPLAVYEAPTRHIYARKETFIRPEHQFLGQVQRTCTERLVPSAVSAVHHGLSTLALALPAAGRELERLKTVDHAELQPVYIGDYLDSQEPRIRRHLKAHGKGRRLPKLDDLVLTFHGDRWRPLRSCGMGASDDPAVRGDRPISIPDVWSVWAQLLPGAETPSPFCSASWRCSWRSAMRKP